MFTKDTEEDALAKDYVIKRAREEFKIYLPSFFLCTICVLKWKQQDYHF